MFGNLATLTMDGKTVAIISINGRIVWKSLTHNVLPTDTHIFEDEVS